MLDLISRNNTSDLRFFKSPADAFTFGTDNNSGDRLGQPRSTENGEYNGLFNPNAETTEPEDVESQIKAAAKAAEAEAKAQLEKIKAEAEKKIKQANIKAILFGTAKLDKETEAKLKAEIKAAKTVEAAQAAKGNAAKALEVDANASADVVDKNNKQNEATKIVLDAIEPPLGSAAHPKSQKENLDKLAEEILSLDAVDKKDVEDLFKNVGAGQELKAAFANAKDKDETESLLFRTVIEANSMDRKEAEAFLAKNLKDEAKMKVIITTHFGEKVQNYPQLEVASETELLVPEAEATTPIAKEVASPVENLITAQPELRTLLSGRKELMPESLTTDTEEIVKAIQDFATAELPPGASEGDVMLHEAMLCGQARQETVSNLYTKGMSIENVSPKFGELQESIGPAALRTRLEKETLEHLIIDQNKRCLDDYAELIALLPDAKDFTDTIKSQGFTVSVKNQLQAEFLRLYKSGELNPVDVKNAELQIRNRILESVMQMTGHAAEDIEKTMNLTREEIDITTTHFGFALIFKGGDAKTNLELVERHQHKFEINALTWLPKDASPIIGITEEALTDTSGFAVHEMYHTFDKLTRETFSQKLMLRTAMKIAHRFIEPGNENRVHPHEVYIEIIACLNELDLDKGVEPVVSALDQIMNRYQLKPVVKEKRTIENNHRFLNGLIQKAFELRDEADVLVHSEELATNIPTNLAMPGVELTPVDAGIAEFEADNQYHVGSMMLVEYLNIMKRKATDHQNQGLAKAASMISKLIKAKPELTPENAIRILNAFTVDLLQSDLPKVSMEDLPQTVSTEARPPFGADVVANADFLQLYTQLWSIVISKEGEYNANAEERVARTMHPKGITLHSTSGIVSYHNKITTELYGPSKRPLDYRHLAEVRPISLAALFNWPVATAARIAPSSMPRLQWFMKYVVGAEGIGKDSIGFDTWAPLALGENKTAIAIAESLGFVNEDPIAESARPYLTSKLEVKSAMFLQELQTYWVKQGLPMSDLMLMLEQLGAEYKVGGGIDHMTIRPLSDTEDQYQNNEDLYHYLISKDNPGYQKGHALPAGLSDAIKALMVPPKQNSTPRTANKSIRIGTMTDALLESIVKTVNPDFTLPKFNYPGIPMTKKGVYDASAAVTIFQEIGSEIMALDIAAVDQHYTMRNVIQAIRDKENESPKYLNPNWKEEAETITIGSKNFHIDHLRWFVMLNNMAKLRNIAELGVPQKFDPDSINCSGLSLICKVPIRGVPTFEIVDQTLGGKTIKTFSASEWASIDSILGPGATFIAESIPNQTGTLTINRIQLTSGKSFYYDGQITKYHEASGRTVSVAQVPGLDDNLLVQLFGKAGASAGQYSNGLVVGDTIFDIGQKEKSLKFFNESYSRYQEALALFNRSDRMNKIWTGRFKRIDDAIRLLHYAAIISAIAIPGLAPILIGTFLFSPAYILAFIAWNLAGSRLISYKTKQWAERVGSSMQRITQGAQEYAHFKQMADDKAPPMTPDQEALALVNKIINKSGYKKAFNPEFEHKYSNAVSTAMGGLAAIIGLK